MRTFHTLTGLTEYLLTMLEHEFPRECPDAPEFRGLLALVRDGVGAVRPE